MEDDTKLRDADVGEMLMVLRVTAVVVHNTNNSPGVVRMSSQQWYCTGHHCGGTDHGTWGQITRRAVHMQPLYWSHHTCGIYTVMKATLVLCTYKFGGKYQGTWEYIIAITCTNMNQVLYLDALNMNDFLVSQMLFKQYYSMLADIEKLQVGVNT